MTVFQKLLGISLLIIALSIAYYFVIFLPNNKIEEQTRKEKIELFNKKIRCKELGEARLKKLNKDETFPPYFTEPGYYYSKLLNSCLLIYLETWAFGEIESIDYYKVAVRLDTNEILFKTNSLDRMNESTKSAEAEKRFMRQIDSLIDR